MTLLLSLFCMLDSSLFYFLIGGKLLYNIVLVSAVQQCKSAIIIRMSSPSRASLPSPYPTQSESSLSTKLGSLCYTATSHQLPWRRKWQPTPVFMPGKAYGPRSLMGYSPWGCKESNTTEQLHFTSEGYIGPYLYEQLFTLR